MMTEQSRKPAVSAEEALRILEDAWAYFEIAPRRAAAPAEGGYDLPAAA